MASAALSYCLNTGIVSFMGIENSIKSGSANFAAANARRSAEAAVRRAARVEIAERKRLVRKLIKLMKKKCTNMRKAELERLKSQHGVAVGDYGRCKKANGAACQPCRELINEYVRVKWITDPKYKKAEKAWRKRTGNNSLYRSNRDRALKHGVKTEYYTRKHIIETWGTDCHICKDPVDFQANPIQGQLGWELYPHMDHVIPISKGGDDLISNIKLAHAKCNWEKGEKVLDQATA